MSETVPESEGESRLLEGSDDHRQHHDEATNDKDRSQPDLASQSSSLLTQEEELLILQCFEMAVKDHEQDDANKFQQLVGPTKRTHGQVNTSNNILDDNGDEPDMSFLKEWDPKILPLH
ncbi:hypothetical protein MPSEU_000397100 [Mayamaea pseudoterrestris]|nr:hypothetical protein MPSEU_000397100 [Mayamaea pseudoterrestris]